MKRRNTAQSSQIDDNRIHAQRYYDDEDLHEILQLVEKDNNHDDITKNSRSYDHVNKYDENYDNYKDEHFNNEDDDNTENNKQRPCCANSDAYLKADASLKLMAKRLEEILEYSRLRKSNVGITTPETPKIKTEPERLHHIVRTPNPAISPIIAASVHHKELDPTNVVDEKPKDSCDSESFVHNIICRTRRSIFGEGTIKMIRPIKIAHPVKTTSKEPNVESSTVRPKIEILKKHSPEQVQLSAHERAMRYVYG